MPDWIEIVRERLPRLPLYERREAEIIEELAEQLQEAYTETIETGASEDEALSQSLAQIPNWDELCREICRAEQGEGAMNRFTRVLCVLAFTALLAVAVCRTCAFRTSALSLPGKGVDPVVIVWIVFAITAAMLALGAWVTGRATGQRAPIFRSIGRFLLAMAIGTAFFPVLLPIVGVLKWVGGYIAFVFALTSIMVARAVQVAGRTACGTDLTATTK